MRYILALLTLALAATPLQTQSATATPSNGSWWWRTDTGAVYDPTAPTTWGNPFNIGYP